MRGNLRESMTSAQIKGRSEFFAELAEADELPTVGELRKMWYEMVRETTESGKVVNLKSELINAAGIKEENRDIVRIGVVNVISDGNFLQWDGDQGLLVELARQPEARYQRQARNLQNASGGDVVDMAIDGTRGAILAQVVKTPTLQERLRQGGQVGYVIVGLGLFGVLFSLWRGIVLALKGSAIKRQLKRDTASEGNALGRILKVYEDDPSQDVRSEERRVGRE